MGLKSTTSCLGYQQITDLSASVGLTIPSINGQKPTLALIVPEAQNVRWRDDGVAPSATVGMPAVVGSSFSYDGNLANIRFIQSAHGAILNVSYYA